MITVGDIFAVNGKVIPHHFLVYLGNELFFDTIDNVVYRISLEEAELALTLKTYCNSFILEHIENLPKNVFDVVVANTMMKCRQAKPLTLVSNNG